MQLLNSLTVILGQINRNYTWNKMTKMTNKCYFAVIYIVIVTSRDCHMIQNLSHDKLVTKSHDQNMSVTWSFRGYFENIN